MSSRPTAFPRSYWDPEFHRHVYAVEFLGTDWRTRIRVPRPGDPVRSGELATVRRLRHRRTPEAVEAIQRQDGPGLLDDLTTRLMFRKDSHPRTYELLWACAGIGAEVVMHYKALFVRPRPVQYDPAIAPVIETPGHPSYPSGHSTQAHLMALALAWLRPKAPPELWRLAWQIAVNREIAGVHFRGDSEAGRALARQLFAIALQCRGYRALLREAEAEWS